MGQAAMEKRPDIRKRDWYRICRYLGLTRRASLFAAAFGYGEYVLDHAIDAMEQQQGAPQDYVVAQRERAWMQ